MTMLAAISIHRARAGIGGAIVAALACAGGAPAQESEPSVQREPPVLAAPAPKAPAPAASGHATVADMGQARAALFVVEEFLDASRPFEDLPGLYAPMVDYYDRGPLSLEIVLRDKDAYMRRWPDRELRPDLATLVVATLGEDVFEVAIETEFEVTNAEARITGRSLVEIVVHARGQGFEVTSESGRVIHREKLALE